MSSRAVAAAVVCTRTYHNKNNNNITIYNDINIELYRAWWSLLQCAVTSGVCVSASDNVRVEVRILEHGLRLARQPVHRRSQTPVQAFVQRVHVVEMQRAAPGPQVHVVRLHLARAPHGHLLVRLARVHSLPHDVLQHTRAHDG